MNTCWIVLGSQQLYAILVFSEFKAFNGVTKDAIILITQKNVDDLTNAHDAAAACYQATRYPPTRHDRQQHTPSGPQLDCKCSIMWRWLRTD